MSIAATLHVEKVGQRKILVGAGGRMIKQIGTKARERIEALVGQQGVPRAVRARDAALEGHAATAGRARLRVERRDGQGREKA